MAEAGSTARTPERSAASGTAACLVPAPWTRSSRYLLAIVFAVGAWLLLAGWGSAIARADVLAEPCPVPLIEPSPVLAVAPVIDPRLQEPTLNATVTPSSSSCTSAPAPAPPVAPVIEPTVVIPNPNPTAAVGSPAPAPVVDGAVPAAEVQPLLPPADRGTVTVAGDLGPLAPATMVPATTDPPPPVPPGGHVIPVDTAPVAGAPDKLPCSGPEPALIPVIDTGGVPQEDAGTDGRAAGTQASRTAGAATPSIPADASAVTPDPADTPAVPVAPPPAPVNLPVSLPVPVPAGPAGPTGPAGAPTAAAAGPSCHGGGQALNGHDTDAVLVAEVATSLAQAALRSSSGFAGAVVGGADDPGVRPG